LSACQAGPLPPKASRARGRQKFHELAAAAGLHLDHQRLAFVHRHAARLADRLQAPVARQAALVHRVAGLVQHAHEGDGEVVLVIAGGDAHVVGHATAEGVQGYVEAAVLEVEADGGHEAAGQSLLPFARERPFQGQDRRQRALARQHGIQEAGQEIGEVREDGVDARRGAARLVLVEQRVVERAAEAVRLGGGGLAGEIQHLGQGRLHGGEIGRRPRLAPDHLAALAGLGERLHQVALQRGGMQPAPLHLLQVRPGPGVETLGLGRGPIEEFVQGGIGQDLVADHAQGRQLLGACLGAAGRHHRRHVPGEHPLRLLKGMQALEFPGQFFVSGHLGAFRAGQRCGPIFGAARPRHQVAMRRPRLRGGNGRGSRSPAGSPRRNTR
jgi:hypothetical protein